MVDDKVHNHSHAERVRSFKHLLEIVESAVFGIDILVVRNIVAVVRLRRNVKGRKPYCVRAKTFDVFEL